MLAYNQHRGEAHSGALALGKEEAPPAREVQARHLLMILNWRGFLPDYQTLLLALLGH